MIAKRLPQIAFAVLALATIGAFFLIQRLKTSPPLLWPPLRSVPAAINPVSGRTCISVKNVPIDYRETKLTLAISHSDSVGVYIVNANDANGPPVATLSAGTQMAAAPGPGNPTVTARDSRVFTWDGSLSDGSVATGGQYYFRVVLSGQDRSIDLSHWPIQVITQPPHPRIVSVRLVAPAGGATTSTATTTGTASTTTTSGGGAGTTSTAGATGTGSVGPAVLSPTQDGSGSRVRITFTGGPYRRAWIEIYRTDVAGPPQRVRELPVRDLNRNWVLWDGKIHGRPAPAGTYLVGIKAQDPACNRASWPVVLPPSPGTTPHAGVTIRYLTVTPPLMPTVSGSRASVAISSPTSGYVWRLRRSGSHKLLAHGSGPAGSSAIRVRMPRRRAGLYTLTVRAGTQSAVVPLVASQAGPAAARARVLVVMPMLSWMGDAPVDDSGDGLPDTLRKGESVFLNRPLVNGPPASLGADATLLGYLDSQHLRYQLTTDVALAEGRGPSLVNRWGVLFPDGTNFLPTGLRPTITGFVRGGGRALTLGTGTFRGVSHITGFPAAPRAGAPVTSAVDPFGVRRGPITPTNGELITELTDGLSLFGSGIAFSGFSVYQPLQPPNTATISAAGIANGTPAIIGFQYGSGRVIEVGLPNFGASLAHDIDSQELVSNAWRVLAKQR